MMFKGYKSPIMAVALGALCATGTMLPMQFTDAERATALERCTQLGKKIGDSRLAGQLLNETSLCFAVLVGDTQKIEAMAKDATFHNEYCFLKEGGIDSVGCNSPFDLAILCNNIPAARTLLAAEHPFNKKAVLETTLRAGEHIAMMRFLIEQEADVNHGETDSSYPPLISAANRNYTKAVELLLQKGADPDVNHPLTAGDDPLLLSVAYENKLAVARLLIAYGADPRKTDSNGGTALDMASLGKHKKMIDLLKYEAIPEAPHDTQIFPQEQCPCCYNEFNHSRKQYFLNPCGHPLCKECIELAYDTCTFVHWEEKNKCILCRTGFDKTLPFWRGPEIQAPFLTRARNWCASLLPAAFALIQTNNGEEDE